MCRLAVGQISNELSVIKHHGACLSAFLIFVLNCNLSPEERRIQEPTSDKGPAFKAFTVFLCYHYCIEFQFSVPLLLKRTHESLSDTNKVFDRGEIQSFA